MDFREYIKKKYLKPSTRILEFGPLNRATVTKETHPNIFFTDIRSTEDVIKMYTANDYLESTGITVDLDSIVHIDYVIEGSYKETFKGVEKFDVALLSHVIEHIPDIIGFFNDITNVLKKDGKLIIIYPDARYCFDHFRNGTTFIDAYDVYKNNENSSNRVFDFVYNVVHENNPNYFWHNVERNDILPKNDFTTALKAAEKARAGELPDDTHFWPFSNYQLIKFLYDMDRAGLLDFDIEEFLPTTENTQECMLVLVPKKKPGVQYGTYKEIFDRVSPSLKEISDNNEILRLQTKVDSLEVKNVEINAELDMIKSSKRWRIASKAARVKHALFGRKK